MAKGKHAAALFEVIHASKGLEGKGTGLLRTPKWWFKGRKSEPAAAAPAAAEPPVSPEPSQPLPADSPASAPAARQPAVDMLIDGQRQQITFRVSYTSAIVTGFTILVVVALAYVVGRQMSRGPAQAMGGPSSEQLRQGPANPQVLDISGTNTAERTVSPPAGGARPSSASPVVPTRSPATAPSGKRIMSMNYVIIQGYPDEASAKAAVEILQEHGVGSTIEKGIRGLKSDWFIVVGTEGFVKVSGREYDAYTTRIQQISDKFAGSRRSFKAFEPLPYKWDRP